MACARRRQEHGRYSRTQGKRKSIQPAQLPIRTHPSFKLSHRSICSTAVFCSIYKHGIRGSERERERECECKCELLCHRQGFRCRFLAPEASLRCDQYENLPTIPATDDEMLTVSTDFSIGSAPQYGPLFEDIAKYTYNLQASKPDLSHPAPTAEVVTEGPAVKKRKLLNGDAPPKAPEPSAGLTSDAPLQFYIQDVSFSVPQRKKLTLELTAGGYLRARNQTSKEVEFGVALSQIRECTFTI